MSNREEASKILCSAVILHGLVHRSLRHAVDSLREKVIVPLARSGEVDVFYHSWDVTEITNPRTEEIGLVLDPAEVGRWLPEAKGIFESQKEFDRTVEWDRMCGRNPMRHCTGSEEAARATLMNFRRALESQKRAWRFFEETKTRSYDRVVVTRGDLRFLEELGTSDIEVGRISVPKFHSWGGVNDRFAMGGEKEMDIYCRRSAFADEWLTSGGQGNSEQNLMEWLAKNRVRVELLDFVFQRVRANGKVADFDRDLMTVTGTICGGGSKNEEGTVTSLRPIERFLILAREAGPVAAGLVRILESLGRVEVIVDRMDVATTGDHRYIHIPDAEVAGYEGLMGRASDLPPITAWSRAFVHLSRTLEDDEMVWFVEDDVAGDAESFARLIELTRSQNADLSAMDIRTQEDDPGWYFWHAADGRFDNPCRAFQPLCRVSPRLIREILRFREEHGRFVFHELLFASLARQGDMSLLDWNECSEFGGCFPAFRYRPEVNAVSRGISHPVKDAWMHEVICGIPPASFKRIEQASLQGWAILQEDYLFLARFCRKHGFTRIVEFGPGDSTLAFLDAGCKVSSYEHDLRWLHHSLGMFIGEDGLELIHCPEGMVPDVLPFAPELVFVDGPSFREGQKMSRLQPCEWALEKCGCFLLHDAKRAGERATLAEMERRGMAVTKIRTRKGLALVVDPRRRPDMLPVTSESVANRYRKHAFEGWFVEDFIAWSVLFGEPWSPVKVLETGVADGVSANLMLDGLFTHPESEVHGVDLYDGDMGNKQREDFYENTVSGGHAGHLHLYEGTTQEVLAWMIAGDGFWGSFDFIYLNQTNSSPEMLADACQAWSLLKPGGILILGGGEEEKSGVEAFLAVYLQRFQLLLDGKRVAVMKI